MHYENDSIKRGIICLFDSQNNSVKQIAKFTNHYESYEVATMQNKVNSYARYFE